MVRSNGFFYYIVANAAISYKRLHKGTLEQNAGGSFQHLVPENDFHQSFIQLIGFY